MQTRPPTTRTNNLTLKGRFPFSVGTTSFLIPADWITNVERFGHQVDEIELLFFDSAYDGCLPGEKEVARLAEAAERMTLRYQVHLPADVFPGDPDPARRREAVKVLDRVIRLSRPLRPVTFTLHLPFKAAEVTPNGVKRWQTRTRESLDALLEKGVAPDCISVENLDYPFEWAWEAVQPLGVRVCMDVGHLLVQGQAPGEMFARHRDHIAVMHLHGVSGSRDHLALSALSEEDRSSVVNILAGYTGSVSLEVFQRPDWEASAVWLLECLETGRLTCPRTHSARG